MSLLAAALLAWAAPLALPARAATGPEVLGTIRDYNRARRSYNQERLQAKRAENSLNAAVKKGLDPAIVEKRRANAQKQEDEAAAAQSKLQEKVKNYLEKEEEYKEEKGKYYSPLYHRRAENDLQPETALGDGPTAPGDAGAGDGLPADGTEGGDPTAHCEPGKVCVPEIDSGHKVSDNTDPTGEASGAVDRLGGYGSGLGGFTPDRNQGGAGRGGTGRGDVQLAKSLGPNFGSGSGRLGRNADDPSASLAHFGGGAERGEGGGALTRGGAAREPGRGGGRGEAVREEARGLAEQSRSLLANGNPAAALRAAELAIAKDPRSASGYLAKAKALLAMGDYEGAEKAAEEAVEKDPDEVEAHKALARARLGQRRHDAALAAANRALQLDPNDSSSYALRAWIKNGLGDRDGVLADLGKAASLDPGRYGKLLEWVRSGKPMYDPEEGFQGVLAAAGESEPRAAGGPSVALLGGLALLLGAGSLGAFAWWKKRSTNAQPPIAVRGS